MDQQNGAPASAVSQAARTVLPGEPFDPPASGQVPGPRQDENLPVPPPVAQWNYPPPEQAYGAPSYQDAPIPGVHFVDQTQPAPPAYQVDAPAEAGDFSSLHEYASLPPAQQAAQAQGYPPPAQGFAPAEYPAPTDYPQTAPESAWPPAAAPNQQPQEFEGGYSPAQYAPHQFPQQDAPLPPLPPPPLDDDPSADGGHRRSGRRNIDKRLLAVIGVVVVAGGGYLLYNQFGKSSSSTASTPVAPAAVPAAPKYDFPANVAGFNLQPAASSATLKAGFVTQVKTQFGAAAAASVTVASYSPGHPAIYAMTFRPGAAKLATAWKVALAQTAAPDPGNVEVAYHTAVPGAAGGVMVCGGERGANASSWCVWHNTTTIGISYIEGSPKTQITEIVTRELRAYAEH